MLLPIKLKSSSHIEFFLDPLASHNCEIEENYNEITDSEGGYDEHDRANELESMRISEIGCITEKINRILGFKGE
jgi:hypothetical protein